MKQVESSTMREMPKPDEHHRRLDSMGSIPPAPSRGKWEGDTLTFESKSEMGESRHTFQFIGDGKYKMRLANRFPGQSDFATFMEGTYVRKT
jgi:hypothetical protein